MFNINWSLRNVKSEVLVNFIHPDISSVTVITNKIALQLDLYIIKNYVKKIDDTNIININASQLSQLKSYLEIIDILYFSHNNSKEHLISNDVECIIKQNQIFDNIVLMSKSCIIKVSPKSDMSII